MESKNKCPKCNKQLYYDKCGCIRCKNCDECWNDVFGINKGE